jgi:hypothetical protein
MAQAATFHLLFALMSLPFCSKHSGIIWSSNVPCLPLRQPVFVITGCSNLPYTCNTHNNHTLIATGACPCKHIQFKPPLSVSILMPNYLTIAVPSCLEKSGFLSAPSVLTAVSTASPTTTVGADADNNFTMLVRLQGLPIQAPPGPCLLFSGACFPTKTQIQVEHKAEKDLKSKTMEEKK